MDDFDSDSDGLSDEGYGFDLFDGYALTKEDFEKRNRHKISRGDNGYIIRTSKKDYGDTCTDSLGVVESVRRLPPELQYEILLLLDDFQLQKIELHLRHVIQSDYFIRRRSRLIFDRIREITEYLKFKKTKAAFEPMPPLQRMHPFDFGGLPFGRTVTTSISRNGAFEWKNYFRVTIPPIEYTIVPPQWSWKQQEPIEKRVWRYNEELEVSDDPRVDDWYAAACISAVSA